MLDWLKQLGGNKSLKNTAGLEKESLDLLVEDFAALDKLQSGFSVKVIRYLVDAEGDEVLAELAGTTGAGEALGIGQQVFMMATRANLTPREKFFEQVKTSDVGFFVRLGKVYEALSRSISTRFAALNRPIQIQTPPSSFGTPGLRWLDALLVVSTRLTVNAYPRRCKPCPALSAKLIEDMLASEGHSPELLLRTVMLPPLQRFGGPPLEAIFVSLSGIGESAMRHPNIVQEALQHPDFKQRVYALEMMKKCNVPTEPFAQILVNSAVGSSKQVREQAAVLLDAAPEAVLPLLEEKIRSGENEERSLAARLLWNAKREGAQAFLAERLKSEKNKKVAESIRELIETPASKSDEHPGVDPLRLPELEPIPPRVPLGAETERAWQDTFDEINRAITEILAKSPPNRAPKNLAPLPAETVAKAFHNLQGPEPPEPSLLRAIVLTRAHKQVIAAFRTFWQRPELQSVHLIRFLIQIGSPAIEQHNPLSHAFWLEALLPTFRRTHPETGLRELGAAYKAAGLDERQLGVYLLRRFHGLRSTFSLPPEQVWPYWAEHLELLENAFGPTTSDFMLRFQQRHARANAFEFLPMFPATPKPLLPLLWDLALGPKSERPQAQRCLESAPDKLERLTASLGKGSGETRQAAAEWLGRTGNQAAIAPLLTALKKESNEATKGAMMSALEQLGAPVDQLLDRATLLKEAEKGLSKGIPDELQSFPLAQLPVVHWIDTGKDLPTIVRWWVVQGYKLKNPEPGPLLRRYCASLKPAEREALGQFILEAWIAADVAPITSEEAHKRAQAHARQMVKMSAYMTTPLTEQQYYDQVLPGLLKQPHGSAIALKGVLSVAGACVGASAAPIINRYLKEWYGQRAAQCKALLQMLAWVEHKTATQLLLAVGSRFRTKGIQEEANKQAEALADRKGWTIAELADRTIPSAGLDENGVLTIDYGPRQFTARLNQDLDFVLTDAEGKVLKALPEPRKDDDEAKAGEAKKSFSAAKKELKSVLTMQRDRLYEAMCTERTWPYEDWSLYLNQHPILKHYTQRLVWAAIRDASAPVLFRPLADGSLTDADDDPVELNSADQIRVAHECQVTPEQSLKWREHLRDYNVEALFEQFGRPGFKLPEDRQNETEIDEFQGHMLEAFRFRGHATKLCYTRGQAQDGGWFFDYKKSFPTLGIEAVIEFTGNSLPEENRAVALTLLHFDRVGEGESYGGNAKMMLSEVPPVLVSECWNDIRAIAAEGSGFDPDWQKKGGQ